MGIAEDKFTRSFELTYHVPRGRGWLRHGGEGRARAIEEDMVIAGLREWAVQRVLICRSGMGAEAFKSRLRKSSKTRIEVAGDSKARY